MCYYCQFNQDLNVLKEEDLTVGVKLYIWAFEFYKIKQENVQFWSWNDEMKWNVPKRQDKQKLELALQKY